MIPRLRMFAGPNGSGKSTIKSVVSPSLLGYYLNPDDIEKAVKERDYFDIRDLDVDTSENEIIDFFGNHPLLSATECGDFYQSIRFSNNEFIDFSNVGFDSYMSAILVDFLRHKYLDTFRSFTFETVMSSIDKIEIMKKAQQKGYKTYLYYVATENPDINLLRIQQRVRMGGHPVPSDKVVSRYSRSLELLSEAIKYSDRAFIFDNSSDVTTWVAEITNGVVLKLQVNDTPIWFRNYVLNKMN